MKEIDGEERIYEYFIRGERERELVKNYFCILSSYYNKLLYIVVYYSMLLKKFRYSTIDKAWFLTF